ncbi:MAG: hypothetical protein ABIQ11_00160 [Saprospiraceae bacterium]
MNSNYTPVLVCFFLVLSGINKTFASSFSILFFNPGTDTLCLWVEDVVVRLSANNNIECVDIYTIDGNIRTVKNKAVIGALVRIEDSHQTYPSVLTDSSGHYQTTFSEAGHLITITPEKTDNPKLGISTLDLVRIQKHLLGVERFSSPYQYISADANNSQHVSAIDLVELRKLILGIYTELPNNTSWRFVASNFQLDSLNQWPFPESRTVLVDHSIYDINFIGIKIGDVSSSSPLTSEDQIEIRKARSEVLWVVDQQSYQKGDEIEIKIRANSDIDLQGFQLTISSPELSFTDVTSPSMTLDESSYANFGDKMTMSWFDENGVDLAKDDIVFTLKAIATNNGNLKTGLTFDSEITDAEVYSMEDEIFLPHLIVREKNDETISTPIPNPWKDRTTIAVNLTEDGNTEIEILDLNGRNIYSEIKYLIKGSHEIILESKNFEARGLMVYSIKNGNDFLTGKMIVVD